MRSAPSRVARRGLVVALVTLSTAVVGPPAAHGETHDVAVVDDAFLPAMLEIEVGDTVIWTYAQGAMLHDVVADDGSFNSGPPAFAPWTFQHTFTDPGVFPYFCSVHGGPGGLGMAGVITVVAPAGPPIADISPTAFTFKVPEGGSDTDALAVGNTGGENLVWSIATDEEAGAGALRETSAGFGEIDRGTPMGGLCDDPSEVTWLSADPDGGITPPRGISPVIVTVDASGLSEGLFEAALCVTTNDPRAPLVVVPVELTVLAPCPIDEHLVLQDMTVVGTEVFEACLTITAGPNFTITASGAATFRAGQRIILRSGFEVDAGGAFTGEIDPELEPKSRVAEDE